MRLPKSAVPALAAAALSAVALTACGSAQANPTPKQWAKWNHENAVALHDRGLADLMEGCAGQLGGPEMAINGSTPFLSAPVLRDLATRSGRTRFTACLSEDVDWWGTPGDHLGAAKQASLVACFKWNAGRQTAGESPWIVGDRVAACIMNLMAHDG